MFGLDDLDVFDVLYVLDDLDFLDFLDVLDGSLWRAGLLYEHRFAVLIIYSTNFRRLHMFPEPDLFITWPFDNTLDLYPPCLSVVVEICGLLPSLWFLFW